MEVFQTIIFLNNSQGISGIPWKWLWNHKEQLRSIIIEEMLRLLNTGSTCEPLMSRRKWMDGISLFLSQPKNFPTVQDGHFHFHSVSLIWIKMVQLSTLWPHAVFCFCRTGCASCSLSSSTPFFCFLFSPQARMLLNNTDAHTQAQKWNWEGQCAVLHGLLKYEEICLFY